MNAQRISAADAPRLLGELAARFAQGPGVPTMTEVYGVGITGVRANFGSQAGPDNENWPERKGPRKGSKRRDGSPRPVPDDGHPLLMETGALYQAATGGGPGHIGRISGAVVVIGVDTAVIPDAGAHNKGNPSTRLPQRQFLGIREEFIEQARIVIGNGTARDVFKIGA